MKEPGKSEHQNKTRSMLTDKTQPVPVVKERKTPQSKMLCTSEVHECNACIIGGKSIKCEMKPKAEDTAGEKRKYHVDAPRKCHFPLIHGSITSKVRFTMKLSTLVSAALSNRLDEENPTFIVNAL